MPDTDLNKLMAAEIANRTDHHWAVAFTVRVHESLLEGVREATTHCPDCGQEHDADEDVAVIADQVVVGCGSNAEDAIARAKAHVYDEEKYGIKLQPDSFQLKGVKLLSVQEI